MTDQLMRSAVEPWPLRELIRIDEAVAAGPVGGGRQAVADSPLVVLVGLTGAGKTTLSKALIHAGLVTDLPGRRRLTDAVILGDRAETLDRAGRFAATAAFRQSAPGGMGEILAALSLAPSPSNALLFDGLRGEAEIAFFARASPKALFLVLEVSDATRAGRIASRGDTFDGSASGNLAKALALVAEESKHYNLDAALDALAIHATDRFHVLDAERLNQDQVASEAMTIIRKAFA